MRGTILNFSIQTNQGVISGDDGKRYEFSGSDWKLSTVPEQGIRVDFDTDGSKALAIYSDPTASQQIKTPKSRVSAGLLAILLGGFGVHYFYLGAWGWGLISILFCWTYIPAIVALVFGVHYLVISDEEFKGILRKSREPFSSCW
ncbi:MAG: TM2 domain-containing protein [Pelatocladus maniniholoensis HA4357-MV3]|jgi:TM2 domain-containing membrane protein YozV|uniref:TM2 domain-containing protein n=1 Tax=Pelatocladus maniniholoensis HA4357-MV3 TaxID=1117104 RepID=A0A9E3LSQ7_9NOST|nr:TM2 domain-containing protein [Pelatocladus maniniholoensis HA4357-MV3]BAZ69606.1 TM2 domain-containing protein [Fischerella sp. NIES-4106]